MTRRAIGLAAPIAALAAIVQAAPAAADKLVFDHRLSPELAAAFDANDPALIAYDASNPAYVTDLVAVRGTAREWAEALVIIARKPAGPVRTAADWAAELKADAARKCAATFTPIAEDKTSVTFERRSQGCAAGYPPVAVYRAVGNGKALFLLAAMARDGFTDKALAQWRAVFASARIK